MRNPQSSFSLEQLDRYLAGTASRDEQDAITQALASDSSLAALLTTLRAVGEPTQPTAMDVETAWRRDQAKLMAPRPSRNIAQHRSAPGRRWGVIGITAATLAIVAGALTWMAQRTDTTTPVTYHTAAGERATVRLANGSRVTLAPATTVRVQDEHVTVTGEAYFTVIHQPTHPLTVRTANAVVQVLGTTFAVRHYPGDPTSRVVVEDGKVACDVATPLHARSTRAVLTAGMLGSVSDSGTMVTRGITVDDYTGWTRGQLVFKEIPLQDVITELSRAYGANIRLADTSLRSAPITMTARVNTRPLSQILDLLTAAVEAHYTRTDSTYVIVAGRAATYTPRSNHFPIPETQYGR